MNDKPLKLSIKIGAVSFEAEGSVDAVISERSAFLDFIDRHSGASFLSERSSPDNNHIIPQRQSMPMIADNGYKEFSSFIDFKKHYGIVNNTDTVMGCVYYLQYYEGQDCSTTRDIRELLQKSRIRSKINIAQFISQNIKRGFIEEVENSDKNRKCIKSYRVLESANMWLSSLPKKTD